MVRRHVVRAIFRRNFVGYFSSPTGYVFIILFIILSAGAAFFRPEFFAKNLANLDPLNEWFPYLMLFFIPAITMGLWAEERKQGTDELLLTLPARDGELILGKYFAALGIYTVSLIFSLTYVVELSRLGRPDLGVMLGTYAGYWFLGAALLAVGSVGSLLSSSMTVAFILGAVFCAVPVLMSRAGVLIGDPLGSWIASLGVDGPFHDLASGVLSLRAVAYFVCLAVIMLYVNLLLLGRRHVIRTEFWAHAGVRAASLVAASISLGVLAARATWRVDLTAERLHSLSPVTAELIGKVDSSRPVYIQAFVSPEVPGNYVEARENLLTLLRELDAQGGDRVHLRIVSAEPYTAEAREAQDKFSIRAEGVQDFSEGRRETKDIFLGVVVTCGTEEVVTPFLHRGLSAEYELARSIGVVSGARRKKVGVAGTDIRLFGGFDFESRSSQSQWAIVGELKKQYDVVQVSLESEITDTYDVLLVAMPSTLAQNPMDHLLAYIKKGGATLLFDDPLPLMDPSLGPAEPRQRKGGPFGAPPGEPKGNIGNFLSEIGISWPIHEVVWDIYNPHPDMGDLPREFVFVSPGSGQPNAFNPGTAITAGLQEMVVLCGGHMRARPDVPVTFTPLLTTTKVSGTVLGSDVLQRSMFGAAGFNPARIHRPLPNGQLILAARVEGTIPVPAPKEGDPSPPAEAPAPVKINAVFVADLDLISEQFFMLRREGIEGLNFDNVTFVLNCVDALAGDSAYVDLRKRRPKHRTLESVETQLKEDRDRQLEETRLAEEAAKAKLQEAQGRLDAKVKELRERTDLDARTREIMVRNLEDVENRRFEATRQDIENEKEARIAKSRTVLNEAIQKIQVGIRQGAMILPPVPAILIGIVVLLVRRNRERAGLRAGGKR